MAVRVFYQFQDCELDRLRRMAQQRQRSKDALGIRDGRMVANGVDAHLLGLCGEYAIAQLTGGTLDERSRLGGDDGAPDVVLPDGTTLNVKTRSQPGYAFLLTPGHAELGADYGVLLWSVPGRQTLTLELGGVIGAEDFEQVCERMEYGHGARIGVRPALMGKRLRP